MSNSSKLSARDRILTLLDDNSFVELGALVTKRNTDFNLQTKEAPSDGVITGYGTINDNPVYVYCQDAAVLNGTIGEMHAKKIEQIYDLAFKVGAPVIALVDCAGLRLEEASDALEGLGSVIAKQAMCSGVIPMITGVLGSCGGGLGISASMSDFIFVEKENGKFFVNTPDCVKENNVNKCDTASAAFKAECGAVDFVCEGEVELLNAIRDLVSILPACNEDEAALSDCEDDLNRPVPEFADDYADPAVALRDIADDGFFVEVKKDFAQDMVVGFIKLDGVTVGAVANRTAVIKDGRKEKEFDAVLSAAGCEKAADFVSFCDSYDIPVVTFTNTTGYCSCMCNEKKLAKAVAKLTFAFSEASVPKVNVITGKALGSAYICMNSKSVGADLAFALEGAQIGAMEPELAAQILCADDKSADKAAVAASYASLQSSAEAAAKRGYVDAIISAEDVRKNVIYALEMLYLKRDDRPAKKHGTV